MLRSRYTEKLKQENVSVKEINMLDLLLLMLENGLLAQLLQFPNHSNFCVESSFFLTLCVIGSCTIDIHPLHFGLTVSTVINRDKNSLTVYFLLLTFFCVP